MTVAALIEALQSLPPDLAVGKLQYYHARFKGRGGTELRFFPVTRATEERAHGHVVLAFGPGVAAAPGDKEDEG